MTHMSTADRWRHNVPATDKPRLRMPLAFLIALLVIVIALGAASFAKAADWQPVPTAQTQTADRPVTPELVIIGQAGCIPCQQLKEAAMSGAISGYQISIVTNQDPLYQEFLNSVAPLDQPMNPSAVGAVNRRPVSGQLFPITWIRGASHYWTGFTPETLAGLQQYLAQYNPRRRSIPMANPPMTPAPASPQLAEAFEGVCLVVTVANLTDQLPDFRADVARRADRALSELVRQTIGDKATARIIAQVADPERYNAVCKASGVKPGANGIPVAVQLLIPERFKGLQGIIAAKAEQALNQHFLVPLQNAGISVIIERIHGETYGAVLEAATGNAADPSPFDSEQVVPFGVAAYLSERSNLAKKLLSLLGLCRE